MKLTPDEAAAESWFKRSFFFFYILSFTCWKELLHN